MSLGGAWIVALRFKRRKEFHKKRLFDACTMSVRRTLRRLKTTGMNSLKSLVDPKLKEDEVTILLMERAARPSSGAV
jgi:hypothetical protein